MEIQAINNYLKYRSLFTEQDIYKLEEIVNKNPWFSIGHQLLLKAYKENKSDKYTSKLKTTSLYTLNRHKLFYFLAKKAEINDLSIELDIDGDIEVITNIDTSLSKEKLLMNFSNEYFSLEQFSESQPESENFSSNDELISKFIQASPRIIPRTNDNESLNTQINESLNDDLVSESLADIYKSQGFYDLAESCYRKLILLNPEKSAYFADLIEKLKDIKK